MEGFPELSIVAQDKAQRAQELGVHSVMMVPLAARGLVLGFVSLWRARRPEPLEEDDLTLAGEFANRAAVSIDNARRYTREREAALTLQCRLLPAELPDLPAIDVAHQYIPAGAVAGVGGDWFDVIPLSGTRVALVVGDVIGHGVDAAATMGRLRTAVHTLADLDLEPEEVLSHLDDLVHRLAAEQEASTREFPNDQVTGASCLYAVYDPVSRACCLARAGHPPPRDRHPPDGRVSFPELPAGPPLGLGGLPFEPAEFELAEGSLLALFTNGLIQTYGVDVEAALDRLAQELSDTTRPLQETCKQVVEALLPARPTDDVALLIARTRTLGEDHVATWTLPAEAGAAKRARVLVEECLTRWHLEEMAFTTELIVSELVTNAYRYAGGPVTLRLIRGARLICEVSDTSSTSPHLRRARSTDEGGRGLFLVAQLTERWGTRYGREGKTVWTEQPYSSAAAGVPPSWTSTSRTPASRACPVGRQCMWPSWWSPPLMWWKAMTSAGITVKGRIMPMSSCSSRWQWYMNRPLAPWKRPMTLTICPAGTWIVSFQPASPPDTGAEPAYSSGARVPPSTVSKLLPAPAGYTSRPSTWKSIKWMCIGCVGPPRLRKLHCSHASCSTMKPSASSKALAPLRYVRTVPSLPLSWISPSAGVKSPPSSTGCISHMPGWPPPRCPAG
ncbi:hypothetical protein GCM10020000_00460 [Streptomyces olivoverticillatus]